MQFFGRWGETAARSGSTPPAMYQLLGVSRENLTWSVPLGVAMLVSSEEALWPL